jgi:Glycosyl hydrolases family 16
VFADDFKRAIPLGSFPGAVSTRWGAYRGTHDTSGHGMYVPGQVVSVHGGVLDIHLHTSDRTHMVAAVYPKVPGGSSKDGFVLGRYVMRFRADETAGYKLVSLLWPDSGNNLRDGEIDFPEGDLNEKMYAYTHHANAQSASEQDWFATGKGFGGWHTAVIERRASSVKYWLDGRLVGTSTTHLSASPMSWVIQAETSLHRTPSDAAQAHILIDWVGVFQPS